MPNTMPPAAAAASLTQVVKRYGEKIALAGVSLAIEPGQVTALLGPNGAGKTTAISLLLGLIAPEAGRVQVLGGTPQDLAVRRRVGMMLQSAALPDTLRVGELLRLVSGYYPNPRPLKSVAELAGIGELLRTPYGKLSGGQQRRVQFALAVCGNPELVFLDEPTTGLDIEARETVWGVVRELTASGLRDPPDDALPRGSRRARAACRGAGARPGRERGHGGGDARTRRAPPHPLRQRAAGRAGARLAGRQRRDPPGALARHREPGRRAHRAPAARRRPRLERARGAQYGARRSIRPHHQGGCVNELSRPCTTPAAGRGAPDILTRDLHARVAHRVPAPAARALVRCADHCLPAHVLRAVRRAARARSRAPGSCPSSCSRASWCSAPWRRDCLPSA